MASFSSSSTPGGSPPSFLALVVAPASRKLPSTLTLPSITSSIPSTSTSPTGTPPQSFNLLPGPSSAAQPSPASPSVSAFGATRNTSSGRRSKRPVTSGAVLAQNAVPDGTKLLTLARALQQGSAQVSTFCSTSAVLESIALPISPGFSSSFDSLSSSTQAAPSDLPLVVFLPLNDLSSALVYASNLLRDVKTTRTALCFQEDHVSNSEKIELAVSMSLEGIRTVSRDLKVREMGVVVVAYSASSSLPSEIIKRCEQAGADLVVCSPYQPGSLKERIQIAIDNAQAHPKRLSPASARLETPSTSPRPASKDLLTLADLSPAWANLADVLPVADDPQVHTLRRASYDGAGMAMTLSRNGSREDGEVVDEEDEGEDQAGKKGPVRSRIFAELVAEMHQQVQVAIEVKIEAATPGLLGPISPQYRNDLINHLAGWDYKPYNLSQDDLYRCNCLLFEATLSIEGVWELEIDQDQIKRFLFSVKALYLTLNPYHNYTHGSDVLQATYSFLVALGVAPPITTLLGTKDGRLAKPWKRPKTTKGRAAEVLRPIDVLTLMIAAIGHDGAHPGLSNAFLKNARAPLSQVYEDKSALEHLHCLLVVSLLKKHGFDFLLGSTHSVDLTAPPSRPLSRLSDQAQAARGAIVDFRKLLFGTILSTDMSMHFSWMTSLVELGDSVALKAASGAEEGVATQLGGLNLSEGARERQAGKDRLIILQSLMKCADISNPARPVEISEYWSSALLDEWQHQATLELGLQLPVSVVKQADAGLQAKGQIAFQDLFVAPLFEAGTAVMPELLPFHEQCSSNRTLWFERLSKLTAPDAVSTPRTRLASGPEAHNNNNLVLEQSLDDTAEAFTIPCALDSKYRLLFPLTLPQALLALPSSPSQDHSSPSSPSGKTPHPPSPRGPPHPHREMLATSLSGARTPEPGAMGGASRKV